MSIRLEESDFFLTVRYGEVGFDGVATLSSLANWLQEAAGQNAGLLGFGEEHLSPLGLSWILARLALRIKRLPAAGERLRVRTWPSALDRFGHRGYEVYDEKDCLIVIGSSSWSVMNMRERRLASLPSDLAQSYPKDARPCLPFCCRVLPRLADRGERTALLRVRRDDLDINGHVNNAHYLAWLMEALPVPEKESGLSLTPDMLDISFRAECFPGDELESACGAAPASEDMAGLARREQELSPGSGEKVILHAIRRRTGERVEETCRAVSLWRKSPPGE